MRNKINRLLSILIIIALLLPILPTQEVYGDINIGAGISNPSYGVGDNAWRMGDTENYYGMRISIYWAESEEDFYKGNVEQVGTTTDVFKRSVPYAPVNFYTYLNVYQYMNEKTPFGYYTYDYEYATKDSYQKGSIADKVIESMPNVINTPQDVCQRNLTHLIQTI